MPTRAPAPSANRNNLKQTPIPVVSRTMPIVNADGTVTRSGQLLLEQLQASTTIEGTHANRPDPSTVPDGSIYVEFDRGVLYVNENGTWQYIAGTMYALLNPDQRPADLGANDAGFEFRSIDTDPNYAPRQFLWSQTEWVETTMVLYGTHAARPAANEKTPPRTIYVESDRGAIYQHQAAVWQYLAGTMWGTMVPDQRPTDLGTHDAGFDFRSTDAPPREFIWSQTAWVETTSISGAVNLTHPNVVTKVGTAGQIVEGGITDLSAANSANVYITAPGAVGFGTTTPGYPVTMRHSGPGTQTVMAVENATNGVNGAGIALRATDSVSGTILSAGRVYGVFDTNAYSAGRVTIQSVTGNDVFQDVLTVKNGAVGILLNTPTFALHLAADSAGKPSTSTWSVVSDLRLKQNIKPVKDDSLAILDRLDWIRFEYNGLANMPRGEKAIGLVAQELLLQLPEAVSSTKTKLKETDTEETEVMAIDYHYIIVHSARAIQQLSAEVQALKALIVKP